MDVFAHRFSDVYAQSFWFWMNRAVILKPNLAQLKDPEDRALKALQTKGYEHEDGTRKPYAAGWQAGD